MKKYTHCIFDADHTLLNYLADEKTAFCALYKRLGMPITDELLALSRTASETAWTEAGLYNVTEPAIQKQYHILYRTHTEDIFARIFEKFPCKTATAKEAGVQVKKQYMPLVVVSDGTVLEENLKKAGKDGAWLQKVLRARDATVADTWLLTVDGSDRILFYKKR